MASSSSLSCKHLRYLFLEFSSVFNSICILGMQISLKNKKQTVLPSTSSHEVRILFMFVWRVLFGLISMLSDLHVTGSWKCTANRNECNCLPKRKKHTKNQPLHEMTVKQHTKLPMKNFLYDDGLFFYRESDPFMQLDRVAACSSAFQCQCEKKLFYLHFMSCFRIVNGNWISSFFLSLLRLQFK